MPHTALARGDFEPSSAGRGYHDVQKLNEIDQLLDYFQVLKAAYSLAYDVVTKFLLATRIKTYSTAHSDYRGFRMLGHLSTHSMILMNYPDDRIEDGEGRDIEESNGMAIDRLLTKLLPQSFSKFEVINQKIEDAMRRRRT